jgi:hypothetical protein
LFAIGVIASAGELNPRVNVTGNSPSSGELLTVKWKYAYAILGSLAVAHLLIFVIMNKFATPVVVKDNSHLAIARLLQCTLLTCIQLGATADYIILRLKSCRQTN